jgi:hypothetical protein
MSEETKKSKITSPIAMPASGHEETKRPRNLSVNAMPTDGFALCVDGKLKTKYETAKDAMTAASKLKHSYPVVQVSVYDATERVYTPVELQE